MAESPSRSAFSFEDGDELIRGVDGGMCLEACRGVCHCTFVGLPLPG